MRQNKQRTVPMVGHLPKELFEHLTRLGFTKENLGIDMEEQRLANAIKRWEQTVKEINSLTTLQ